MESTGSKWTGSDAPTVSDELDMNRYVDSLANLIMESETPLSISIQGPWGSGKSSIMKMLRADIESEGEGRFATAWVETWAYSQFSSEDTLAAAVMYELSQSLKADDKDAEGSELSRTEKRAKFAALVENVFDITTEIAAPTVVSALTAFVPALYTSVIATAIENTAAHFGRRRKRRRLDSGTQEVGVSTERQSPAAAAADIRALRDAFEAAVNETGKTWVFFIDDLDRLPPARAVELMEAIQIFLAVPGCVFVLAIDFEVVKAGVSVKYGSDMAESKARSFFDKLIQLPFFVPQGGAAYTDFVKRLLREPDLEETLEDFELLRYSIGSNPRAAKRLALAYSLEDRVALRNAESRVNPATTKAERFAVLCLRAAYPTVYEHFLATNIERGNYEGDAAALPLPGHDDFNDLESFGEATDIEVPSRWKVEQEQSADFRIFIREFVRLFVEGEGSSSLAEATLDSARLRSALGLPTKPSQDLEEDGDRDVVGWMAPFDAVLASEALNENVDALARAALQFFVGELQFECKVQVNRRVWSLFSDKARRDQFGEIQLNKNSVAIRFLNVRKLDESAPSDLVEETLERAKEEATALNKRGGSIKVIEYPKYNVRLGVLGLASEEQFRSFEPVLSGAAQYAKKS